MSSKPMSKCADMAPKEWTRTTVGEACAIKNNLRLPLNVDQRGSLKGPYPYMGPTGILDYIDHYRVDEEFAVIGEDGDHFLKYRDKPMTLYYSGKANVNNHAHIIGASERCSPKWFYYWFMHRDLSPSLTRQGVGRYKLTKKALSELEIWLPKPVEQRTICELLDTWAAAIDHSEKLAENARAHKSALIERLVLGPSRDGRWKLRRVDEVAIRVQRQATSQVDLPVLMISAASGFVRQDEKYSRFMAGKSVENYVALEEGEFAYNKGNSKRYEFGCVFPLKGLPRGLVPHVYVCFRLHEEHDRGFFEHLFAADFLHDQLGSLVNTGVRNNGLLNIRPADFLACKVPVPLPDEQAAIAARLAVATEWTRLCDEYLARLRAEKNALMTDLLAGKRRVRLPAAETA